MNVQNEIKEIYEKLGSINTRLTESRQLTGGFHNLLSATHSDTESASPLRGSLITGQTATPEWRRLALGSTGTFLRSDGTDPSWASLIEGDLPSHDHVKADITDTPWAWADVLKTGSLLNDIGNVNASPGDGDVLTWVDGSSEWQSAAGGGGAPTDGQYLVLAYETGLSEERLVTEGVGITLTDAGAGDTFTIACEFHETIGTETGNLLTAGYVKADEHWIKAAATAYYLRLMSGETLTNDKTLDIYLGDTNRVLSLLGGGLYITSQSVYLDQNLRQADSPEFNQIKLRDTGGDHTLDFDVAENLSGDKTLSLLVSDTSRTLSLAANLYISGTTVYADQDLRTSASPQFSTLRITAGSFYTAIDSVETPTGNRTLYLYLNNVSRTLNMAGDLYCESGTSRINQDLTDDAEVEFAELRLGTNPAVAGLMGIPNNQIIYGRNQANSADLAIIRVSTSDTLQLGAQVHINPATAGGLAVGDTDTEDILSASPGGRILKVKHTSGEAHLAAEGSTGAYLDLVDTGGGSDDKWLQLFVDAGVLKLQVNKDDDSALQTANILTVDLGTGECYFGYNVGFGDETDPESPVHVRELSDSASAQIRLESDTAIWAFSAVGSAVSGRGNDFEFWKIGTGVAIALDWTNRYLGLRKSNPSYPVDINFSTNDLGLTDAGTAGATYTGWIECYIAGAGPYYIPVLAAK